MEDRKGNSVPIEATGWQTTAGHCPLQCRSFLSHKASIVKPTACMSTRFDQGVQLLVRRLVDNDASTPDRPSAMRMTQY